jgi:hypothetical protein
MKISIPRETVGKFMHDYNCSEEKAAKEYLDAQNRSHKKNISLIRNQLESI